MSKISPLLQDLRLELYQLTTLVEGQYIMRGLVTGTSYAASPSLWNDLVRRFTNTNRDRYQEHLSRAVDKLLEYADLLVTSAIFTTDSFSPDAYALKEFMHKLTCLEACHQTMLIVSGNLEKVKTHYVEIADANFAIKIDDLRAQLQKTASDISTKRRQLVALLPPPSPPSSSSSSSIKKQQH
jgi:hypothetical protein